MAYAAAHARTMEKGRGLTVTAGERDRDRVREGEVESRVSSAGSEVDARLVAQARRGDRQAFEALVRRHMGAAYPVALSRVSDPQDAEDVVQDAFVTALEKLDSCEQPEHFRAWFLTIVRNRAHNVRKYEAVRRAQPLDEAIAGGRNDDPALALDRARLRERLRVALGHLTELQRRVVVLHDYEGWKHKEIGAELGISAGASRFHLHVARRRLRNELADLRGYLPGERS